MSLNFYDVDKDYVKFLQQEEIKERGFTCVPNMEYGNKEQKFLCGVVLNINGFDYYVPVTSYKTKQSENILIVFEKEKHDKVKGSLRFNYMFPVPKELTTVRVFKKETNVKRRLFLIAQLEFCLDNATIIHNKANRTYQIITKQLNKTLLKNACDFKLLEQKCLEYKQSNALDTATIIAKLETVIEVVPSKDTGTE